MGFRPPQIDRARRFTDADLRAALADGLSTAEIASRFQVSPQAVRLRKRQLGLSTVAAAVAPEESRRYVRSKIEAIEELVASLAHVRLLRDACDRYLRDPDHPDRYDVGPRAAELEVIYWRLNHRGEKLGKKPERKDLQSLLDVALEQDRTELVAVETKHADPRQLILSTCAEARQTVSTAVDLAKFLAEAKRMEEFREEMLAAINEVAPEVRDRIVERLRSRLVLHAAVSRPGALPD